MKLRIWFNWQFGLMLCFGKTFAGEPYVSIDIPFCIIQLIIKNKTK